MRPAKTPNGPLRRCLFWPALVLIASAGCVGPPAGQDTECGDGICEGTENPASCPEDCNPCGNGVAEPHFGEACDEQDFGALDCTDFDCEGGMLTCTSDCRVSAVFCIYCETFNCGNGTVDATEECDCGMDPLSLPPDCTAYNGDTQGECDAHCRWFPVCGDGILQAGEECDCGEDPQNLPQDCNEINGNADGACKADCTLNPCVTNGPFLSCNPNDPDPCPNDLWGNPMYCETSAFTSPLCMRACTDTLECYHNELCFTQFGMCYPALCGTHANSMIGGQTNAPCQIPGGNPGWCMPLGLAKDDLGVCVESSTNALPQDAQCTPPPCDWAGFPRNIGIETCLNGSCVDLDEDGTHNCATFCSWEDVYDNDSNSTACGGGYNCFGLSTIDPTHPDPDHQGIRSPDVGVCTPTEATNPAIGLTTCDLLNQELISDRSQTCVDADPAYTCEVLHFAAPPPQQPATWGSLIGACQNAGASNPNRTIWEICDTLVDVCPPGSKCIEQDICNQPALGPTRCIPYCDTDDATPCAHSHPELPLNNECTSLSALFKPGPNPCSTLDDAPTRLGLCALPP